MKDAMPRKMSSPEMVPSLVSERLSVWGRAIRTQRVRQRIAADQLCGRIGVSRATLSRMERGDPAVNVAGYLAAFLVLGIFDDATPPVNPLLWESDGKGRVKARLDGRNDDF